MNNKNYIWKLNVIWQNQRIFGVQTSRRCGQKQNRAAPEHPQMAQTSFLRKSAQNAAALVPAC